MNKTRILIVEDEGIVAAELAGRLERLGYDVAGTVERGEEAVAEADRLKPDLVLMDIRLKGPMDGVEAADAIRRKQDVPVVYLTAHSDPATLERAKLTGPFGYVLKPYDERDLATQIEMALYRHQADRQLREQREWFRVTLASIGDAVIATDAAGRVTFVNPVAESLTGWKAEEAADQPLQAVFRVVNEQTGQPLADPVVRALRERRAVALANHAALVTKDGRTVPIEDSAAPILDAAGEVIGAVLVFHDVTEKRRAEETIESLAQFPAENPHPVLRIGREGQVLYVNKAAEELLEREGWQRGGEIPAIVREPAMAVFPSGRESQFDIVCRDHRVFSFLCVPLAEKDYANLYGRDITDRKRAEEELIAARAAAEQANRAKDHFLAVLSHELRTPLTPVVMGVSMLQDDPDLGPEARETLEMVHRNIQMEARLIDDLLDVSRIARGKIELNWDRVELCAVIQQAVEVCRPDIEARRLHFGVDLGPGAPYWVEADAARLQQVLWNLLKNAIKFTPQDGCVGIRCRPDHDHVLIEVNDSGIGIEREALSRVFNAFEQAERSITRQFGGLGLGLAISKSLVEMHGGAIEAHSEGPGKGATFRVRWPLAAPAGSTQAAPGAAPRRATRPLRILLVEDHGITAKMMKKVLTAEGHTVEMAGDVGTALEMAGRATFDLLMSDLGLPDGSGHDLMRQLRARGHRFPGIALSGYGLEEDIQRSYQAGFAAHLTKPASREAVVAAIGDIASRDLAAPAAETATAAEGASGSGPPVFDVGEALERCGDMEMLREMIECFFCEVRDLFPQMRCALEAGDLEEVGRLGHRMKGTLLYFGAPAATQAAMRVERFCKSSCGTQAEAEEAVGALERECAALTSAVAGHLPSK